jgi:hypothetical protein
MLVLMGIWLLDFVFVVMHGASGGATLPLLAQWSPDAHLLILDTDV